MRTYIHRPSLLRLIFIILQLMFPFLIQTGIAKDYYNMTGNPLITSYDPIAMNMSSQNWGVTVDNNGRPFFANNGGIGYFDGYYWNCIKVKNRSIVRSVFKSSDGTIYAGAYNEFGYISVDLNGKLEFISLLNNNRIGEIGEVWKIMETDFGIVFQTFSSILLYRKNKIILLADNEDFNFAQQIDKKQIIIGHNKKGVMRLTSKGLEAIPGAEIFKGKSIHTALKLDDDQIIIATSLDGFYIWKNNKFSPWETDISQIGNKQQIYSGLSISKGCHVIGTIKNGLYFFDSNGKVIKQVNQYNGLQNNAVYSIYCDDKRNLWVATDNGISYIKLNTPLSYLIPKDQIGTGYVSHYKDNKLYLGTNQGLFYYDIKNANKKSIEKVIDGQVWNIQTIDDETYSIQHDGIFHIQDKDVSLIHGGIGCWKIIAIPDSPNYIVSTYTGLHLYISVDGILEYVSTIDGFSLSCRELILDQNEEHLWLSNPYNGVYRLKLNKSLNRVIETRLFNESNGLPTKYGNTVFSYNDSIYVAALSGIYSVKNNTMIRNEQLTQLFGDIKVERVQQVAADQAWIFQENKISLLQTNYNGRLSIEHLKLDGLENTFVLGYENITQNDNQLVINSTKGFINYDKNGKKTIDQKFDIQIHSVKSIGEKTIYGGNFRNSEGKIVSSLPNDSVTYLANAYKNISIEISALDFSDHHDKEFSFFLEGRDSHWSSWTTKNTCEFQGLSSGDYTVFVKAKSNLGQTSNLLQYQFHIAKPWYLSKAMLTIYFVMGLMVLFTIVIIIRFYLARKQRSFIKKRQKEEEEKELEYETQLLRKEKQISLLQTEKLEAENLKSKSELLNKEKELASIVMKITYTNQLINNTGNQLMKISEHMEHLDSKRKILALVKQLDKENSQDEDWKQFEIHFDLVHENFIKKLRNEYPNLTSKDIKMASYIRMNMETKEIAQLFSLTPRAVETSRYRLRKRLELQRDENLTDFLLSI